MDRYMYRFDTEEVFQVSQNMCRSLSVVLLVARLLAFLLE